jgi:hypothetical protein
MFLYFWSKLKVSHLEQDPHDRHEKLCSFLKETIENKHFLFENSSPAGMMIVIIIKDSRQSFLLSSEGISLKMWVLETHTDLFSFGSSVSKYESVCLSVMSLLWHTYFLSKTLTVSLVLFWERKRQEISAGVFETDFCNQGKISYHLSHCLLTLTSL